jgi:hypothetical protein
VRRDVRADGRVMRMDELASRVLRMPQTSHALLACPAREQRSDRLGCAQ